MPFPHPRQATDGIHIAATQDLGSSIGKATAMFSTTLEALEASRATRSKEEYLSMCGYGEPTRLISRDARMALVRHGAEHGCDSMGAAV